MRNLLTLLPLALASALPAFSQCPESNREGVHIVQKGETLFRIAGIYAVRVSDLRAWNQLDGDLLSPCQALRVLPPKATDTPPPGTYPMQAGPTHIVQSGESAAGIAALYGYTEMRFRLFNRLAPDEPLEPGMVLRTEDCDCPALAGQDLAAPDKLPYPGSLLAGLPVTGLAEYPAIPTEPRQAGVFPPDTLSPAENQHTAATTVSPGQAFRPAVAGYLSTSEKMLLDEINLVRTNPAAYLPLLERSILAATDDDPTRRTAMEELRTVLRQTKPMEPLSPVQCLYLCGRKHLEDQSGTPALTHRGTDGSWPWERIRRDCPDLTDGNEIILPGGHGVRTAVLTLLIDAGYPGRGHRQMVLDPQWKYAACLTEAGSGSQVDDWLVLFGK